MVSKDRYAHDDDTVVFDAMSETASRLIGLYAARADSADTPEEEKQWMGEVIRVRDGLRATDPHDRAAMRRNMDRWADEYKRLER